MYWNEWADEVGVVNVLCLQYYKIHNTQTNSFTLITQKNFRRS